MCDSNTISLIKIDGQPANQKSQIKIENCESVFHVERPVSPKYDGINRHRHHVKLRKNEIIHSCFTMINGQHCSNLDGLIAKTCPLVPAYIGKWGQSRVTEVIQRSLEDSIITEIPV